MKKAGLVLWIFVLAVSALGQNFYDINTIHTIEITFTESNWDYLLDNFVSEGNEERLVGSVSINGERYDSVGVRYKGNSSYSANRVKNPLNIKLDYIIDNQEIQGYGTLKLANVFKDPSFVREALSYEIARNFIPASGSNFAKVSINGTYLGLYANDQDVDKAFMRSHFGSGGNARFKGEISDNLPPHSMGGVWEYLGQDSSDYYSKYAIESDYGWAELISFLDTLNNNNTSVDQVLNIDRHLWFLAFQNLLVNLDGPINNPQNYYMYKDDNHRFNPIPWDLNESFGVFSTLQSTGNLSPYQLQRLSPFVNLTSSDYPIISKVLDNERYLKMYVAHMKTMLAEIFESGWYHDRALEIQAIIADEVNADPNKFYTYSNFISNVTSTVGSSGPPPNSAIIGLTELMEARIAYINTLSDFSAASPVVVTVGDSSTSNETDTSVRILAEVEDASNVLLAYRLSSTDVFQFIDMADDGLHDDGEAGDGIYGSIEINVRTTLQYYIYAENEQAGIFDPQFAATEFYTIQIPSNLVINEFLADNESVIADQDGDFDDWIELYNNSDTDIQLAGYFLSDDGGDLQQWVFPDTLIAAHDFLIVWADNDEDQVGLHANFKLSASGEAIYLLAPDSVIVNAISFAAQAEDSTTGRYPDGVGEFMRMVPTFQAANQGPLSIAAGTPFQPEIFTVSQNYPNPFNGSTKIRYFLPLASPASLNIYDIRGVEILSVDNIGKNSGWQEYVWDGLDESGAALPTGIYLGRIQSGTGSASIKMLLLK